ncbi:Pfs, NACHT and ankyrin domain protein, partial [Podospora didyma]
GAENVKALFKNSHLCSSIPFVKFALGYAFGLPAKALTLYDKDDSGGGPVPYPGSTVADHNRIDYPVYATLVRFLEGPGLLPFWRRFENYVQVQMESMREEFGPEWEYRDDLMKFVGDAASYSFVNALCGKYLLALNPTFMRDYWDFDRNLQTYLQGIPWFLAPKAYAARRRVLKATEVWQQYARDNYTESCKDADGDDPFWGSSYFRERHGLFLKMDGFDHRAIACQDFGSIWAGRNAITSTEWAVFELYRDPELLAAVREEVDAATIVTHDESDDYTRFDIQKLLRSPILQAVYAETLRLRMHFYLIRMPDRVGMNIHNWIIPKQKVVVACTTVAHMDPTVWNTNNEHPVDQFWIGRYLKYPAKNAPDQSPTFSTKEFDGSWIPYGGGPRQCPGRHFAKRQILITMAYMVRFFDVEILGDGKDVKEDFTLWGYGSGVSHPAGKVPMRIRRRPGY